MYRNCLLIFCLFLIGFLRPIFALDEDLFLDMTEKSNIGLELTNTQDSTNPLEATTITQESSISLEAYDTEELLYTELNIGLETNDTEESTPAHESNICLDDNSAQDSIKKGCGKGPHPIYISMRHIEADGIGYNQGYTTLDGFFRLTEDDNWLSFLDMRGHLFNNGNPAANAGFGVRRLTTSRIWGVNAYYDYRKTNHQHYSQVSVGLESLGKTWDYRINGYLPFGKKQSHLYDLRFDEFKEHYAYITRKYEFAMKGVNAEVGVHINNKNAPLYFAAGPYYLQGQGKTAWGGEARFTLDVFDYIRLEANTSYDNVFKWIGQGQISLVIPFGQKKTIQPKKQRSCEQQLILAQRAMQRVDRFEIIPVDKKRKKTQAIDPLTGKPYFFWFVNNTSHSNGTFESPFNTLIAAQNASSPNDVIYVYPGDGTSTGMNVGILLQNNQKLFGAGIEQILRSTAGKVTIPAMASGLPLITNPLSVMASTITCANNNEISGVHIVVPSSLGGVDCTSVSNPYIHNNIIDVVTGTASLAASFIDCTGQVILADNQINFNNASPSSIGVFLANTSPQTTNYVFKNNTFSNLTTNSCDGFDILLSSSIGILTIRNNQFINMTTHSISALFHGTGLASITANTFSKTSELGGIGDIALSIAAGGSFTTQITSNNWINTVIPSTPSVHISTNHSSVCVMLDNNFSDSTPNAYVFANSLGQFTAEIGRNTGHIQEIGTVVNGPCP